MHGFELARQLAEAREAKSLTAHGTLYKALGRLGGARAAREPLGGSRDRAGRRPSAAAALPADRRGRAAARRRAARPRACGGAEAADRVMVASRVALAWARVYTRGMPDPTRRARLDELASDLWEHLDHASRRGRRSGAVSWRSPAARRAARPPTSRGGSRTARARVSAPRCAGRAGRRSGSARRSCSRLPRARERRCSASTASTTGSPARRARTRRVMAALFAGLVAGSRCSAPPRSGHRAAGRRLRGPLALRDVDVAAARPWGRVRRRRGRDRAPPATASARPRREDAARGRRGCGRALRALVAPVLASCVLACGAPPDRPPARAARRHAAGATTPPCRNRP